MERKTFLSFYFLTPVCLVPQLPCSNPNHPPQLPLCCLHFITDSDYLTQCVHLVLKSVLSDVKWAALSTGGNTPKIYNVI